ncbi:MAG: phosphatidate cytidylyltransferase [Flavobacteriaceae bacterium]
MKELMVRGISGLLYITIIIFAMFASQELFLALFFILGLLTIHEFQRLVQLKSYLSYFLFSIVLFFLSYKHFSTVVIDAYAITAVVVNLLLLSDLLFFHKIPIFEKKNYILLIFYLIAGFVFLGLIPMREFFKPEIIAGIFILVWANDSCAYLVGKNFGKHKLLERVSPKKTVEGFLGGLVGSVIASLLIFKYWEAVGEIYTLWIWIGLALIVAVLGTVGDLIQSKIKRQAGVKDSGILMPGHGGIYDRLDSVLYVSPFIYLVLEITDYVS